MNRIVRLIERLSDWMAGISAVMLALMTLLILVEILLWNTVSKTTLIADEYSAYGLAAIIFMGAGYCLKEKGHIRITLILSFMPRRLAATITFAATAVTTAFMGYLWWYLFQDGPIHHPLRVHLRHPHPDAVVDSPDPDAGRCGLLLDPAGRHHRQNLCGHRDRRGGGGV